MSETYTAPSYVNDIIDAVDAEQNCPGLAYAVAIKWPHDLFWFCHWMYLKTPEGLAQEEEQRRIRERKDRAREETRLLRQQVFKPGDALNLGCAIRGFLREQRKIDYHCARQKDALWSRHALAACIQRWGEEMGLFLTWVAMLEDPNYPEGWG